MTTANPYDVPEAELQHSNQDTYTPSLLKLNGRITRSQFVVYSTIWVLAVFIGLIALGVVIVMAGAAESMEGNPLWLRVGEWLFIILGYAAVAVQARRRLQDLGWDGWLCVFLVVPFINFIMILFLVLRKGFVDASEYFGPAPQSYMTQRVLAFLIILLILTVSGWGFWLQNANSLS